VSGRPREYYQRIAEIGVQAAEALHHAHQMGIVHRDIKPSNLMIDQRGKLWVTDFGLARFPTDSPITMTGDFVGTLRYMSPEQANGQQEILDHRTDIYSLGITLYELLTLQPAFGGTDRAELVQKIIERDPPLPRSVAADIPKDLETIVLKAIEKDAADRYATAAQLANDLRSYLQGCPVLARRPTLLVRSTRWAQRHFSWLCGAVAILLVLAAVTLASAVFTIRAYSAEAQQRKLAESNLALAAQAIDHFLARVSQDQVHHGNWQHAELLASDAARLYGRLLETNDDPELRYRAAVAYGQVADIWNAAHRQDKMIAVVVQANRLLERLVTDFPDQTKYLDALGWSYNRLGLSSWSADRWAEAEGWFRQGWEVFAELNARYPDNHEFQNGLAAMLSNLGCVYCITTRFGEAGECFQRAESITDGLPPDMQLSAQGLANKAGSLTSRAQIALFRENYEEAIGLLESSVLVHRESLAKWPNNLIARDCLFATYGALATARLQLGQHQEAAKVVETYVDEFALRLETYHMAAEHLLACAAIAASATTSPAEQSVTIVDSYRELARNTIRASHTATERSASTVRNFAWFLLTCEDQSIRDYQLALELAQTALENAQHKPESWQVLSLAQTRTGDLLAAARSLDRSLEFEHGDWDRACAALLKAIQYGQQSHFGQARQFYEQATHLMQKHAGEGEQLDLVALTGEAAHLIESEQDHEP
jgi:tetratricopeptide (TPR) repeat protein